MMCGIFGIVQTQSVRPLNGSTLHSVISRQTHRGPDGSGVWISPDGRVGLGHRRLAIIDLSNAGKQPMANADGSIYVTFNGEIYNFRQLRLELESKGYRFRSQSDTEVLVYLYLELGEAMLDRLDGDYAFGIWDDRRKRLFLARDRVGVKPLYYIQLTDRFLFASEIKTLLAYPSVPRQVDRESLYHYLTYLTTPAPKTLFEGIRKLPAAGKLTLDFRDDHFRIGLSKHWEPLPGQCVLRESELDEQFQELFSRSVTKRLMSDVPVGILFSGGVDSTLNAASFGQAIAPNRVRTFNVGVRGTRLFQDESDFANEMAGHLGTEHHSIHISEDDLLDSVESIARQQDEPLADPVCVPLFFVTRLARQTGTIVLHAGEGADEIFCGYDKYQRFIRYYQRMWRPLSRLPKFIPRLLFALMSQGRGTRFRKMADSLRRLAYGQEFFLSSSVAYYEHEKQSILSSDFRHECRSIDSFDVVEDMYQRLDDRLPDATFLQKLTYIELQLRLPELLLMRVDKMSMLNSVEVRVPFLDRDLVDFALSVPDSFKLRGGVAKEPVKRRAAQFVRPELVYRRKAGFGAPIQEWFRSRLGREMLDQVRSDRSTLAEWFDIAELERRLIEQPRTVNDAFQLWIVYNFMQWHRSFFTEPSAKVA